MKGIEPSSQAWEARILPLNHTRGPQQRTCSRIRRALQLLFWLGSRAILVGRDSWRAADRTNLQVSGSRRRSPHQAFDQTASLPLADFAQEAQLDSTAKASCGDRVESRLPLRHRRRRNVCEPPCLKAGFGVY